MTRTRTTTQNQWLLTVSEVAEISRQSESGVRWAIREGHLAANTQSGRKAYLITRKAVADWLGLPLEDIRSRCSQPTPGDGTDHAA